LAEFERSLIRERIRAGLAAARRAGRTGGRPPKLTDDDIETAKAMLANPDIDTGGEFNGSAVISAAACVRQAKSARESGVWRDVGP
jgi:DNA invertase Pin-like site-specific DNA recombinase